MIDRAARESLAERLRQLASGAITNFRFEEGWKRSKHDPAVHEIAECMAWPYYDDTYEHRLEGDHALLDGHRKDFARAVLFLKCDFEYRWPKRSGLAGWSGQIRRIFRMPLSTPKRDMGEVRYWPFWSEEDYREALHRHPYLAGSERQANQPPEHNAPTGPAISDSASALHPASSSEEGRRHGGARGSS